MYDVKQISLPSGNHSSTESLELYHYVCQFEISLLLQMSQYTSTEENLTLTNSVQVGVKLQSINLEQRTRD